MLNADTRAALEALAAHLKQRLQAIEVVLTLCDGQVTTPPPAASPGPEDERMIDVKRFKSEAWAKRHVEKLLGQGIESKTVYSEGMWEVRPC